MGIYLGNTSLKNISLGGSSVKSVHLGSDLVRPKWEPNENTLLYLPLENDFVDKSGQATTRAFSTNGLSYTTVGGVPSVHIGTTGGAKLTTPYPIMPSTNTNPLTFSILVYVTSAQTSSRRIIMDTGATNGNRIWCCIYENSANIRFAIDIDSVASVNFTATGASVANQWIHILATVTTTASKFYINGQLVQSGGGSSIPRGRRPYSYDNTQGIFCTRDVNDYRDALNGNAREFILEQVEWSADDVSNYYNYIKSKLGF